MIDPSRACVATAPARARRPQYSTLHCIALHYITLQLAPAGLSSIAKSTEIVFAYLWQLAVFGEVPRVMCHMLLE